MPRFSIRGLFERRAKPDAVPDTTWLVSSSDCCAACLAHDGKVLSANDLERDVMAFAGPVYDCVAPAACTCTATPTGVSNAESAAG